MSKGSSDSLKAGHKRHNVPENMDNIVEEVFSPKQHFRHNANLDMDDIVSTLCCISLKDVDDKSYDISSVETPVSSNKRKTLGSHTNLVLSQESQEKHR